MAPPDDAWVEAFRHYLACLGRLAMGPALRGKLDLSGVVQLTLLEAHRAADPPPASDPDGRMEWVRRLFLNNLRDEARKLRAARRDVARELPPPVDGTSYLDDVPAELSSPSRRASKAEELVRLTAALAALPPDQRDALELRYLGGLTVDEVAGRMGRTRASVAGLLRRGFDALCKLMNGPGPPPED